MYFIANILSSFRNGRYRTYRSILVRLYLFLWILLTTDTMFTFKCTNSTRTTFILELLTTKNKALLSLLSKVLNFKIFCCAIIKLVLINLTFLMIILWLNWLFTFLNKIRKVKRKIIYSFFDVQKTFWCSQSLILKFQRLVLQCLCV